MARVLIKMDSTKEIFFIIKDTYIKDNQHGRGTRTSHALIGSMRILVLQTGPALSMWVKMGFEIVHCFLLFIDSVTQYEFLYSNNAMRCILE